MEQQKGWSTPLQTFRKWGLCRRGASNVLAKRDRPGCWWAYILNTFRTFIPALLFRFPSPKVPDETVVSATGDGGLHISSAIVPSKRQVAEATEKAVKWVTVHLIIHSGHCLFVIVHN